ncbi:MAG: cold-shock protein [Paracoccaceae bacterium]
MGIDEEKEVSGHVKWFDPIKGFGFIVSEVTQEDVLLHANVLRRYGQNSVAGNAKIVFLLQNTDKGLQAHKIISIETGIVEQSRLSDFEDIEIEEIRALPLKPARIKWFDIAKGFGFANTYGSDEDIFVHIDVLRRSGLADLRAGEAVAMRVLGGKRGQMAAEICPWESALELGNKQPSL